MQLAAGRKIGPYEIVGPIGAGGMSEVYRARDLRLERDVALKVLQGALASRAPAVARFEKEAKAVASLSHPNVIAIYDYGVEEGTPYIVMELLEGETLRRSMNGPMPWRQAAKIAATIADALRAAHARHVVHRDLKPENIIVAHDGTLKVLDFGLARVLPAEAEDETQTLTGSGTILGTPAYMSPEQVRAEPLGPGTDLFALGCVFYELLTGRRPFGRNSTAETLAAILRDEPEDLRALAPDTPEPVARVVEHCLEKDPRNRFQSAADFAFALAAAVDGSKATARPSRTPPADVLREKRLPLVFLALLFIGIVAAIVAVRRTPPAAPATQSAARSLAVLPFANSNGDPALAWLSEGLTEGIINNLSPVENFKVLSRDSVFSYRRRSSDPREIGRDLGVDAVVSGRVMQRGHSLVVSVELIDARDGNHIWGERYDRPLTQISELERDLSKQISERLQMRLTGEARSRMNRRAAVNPEAYRLYLQGRHEWNKRTPQGIERGIELFRQSIDADPAYAPAHAGIADSYLLLGGTYEILPPKESMPLARQSALRALEIDPELAEAHASLGVIAHEFEWDWARAEQSFGRSIELNPNYGVARQWYGQALLYRARFDDALAQLNRAVELDPLSLVTRSDLAQAHWIMGRHDAAIAHAEKLTEMAPRFWLGHWFLGLAHAGKGDLARATEALEHAVALGGSPATIGTLGYVHGRAGRRGEAERLLRELRDLSRTRYVSPAAFGAIYIGLGDLDRAFAEVERAIEERAALVTVMHVVPITEPLRRDPRYAAYARRVGLPPVP